MHGENNVYTHAYQQVVWFVSGNQTKQQVIKPPLDMTITCFMMHKKVSFKNVPLYGTLAKADSH